MFSPSEATCAAIIFTPISKASLKNKGLPKVLSKNPALTVCSSPI